jgi:hypothetical protein
MTEIKETRLRQNYDNFTKKQLEIAKKLETLSKKVRSGLEHISGEI